MGLRYNIGVDLADPTVESVSICTIVDASGRPIRTRYTFDVSAHLTEPSSAAGNDGTDRPLERD